MKKRKTTKKDAITRLIFILIAIIVIVVAVILIMNTGKRKSKPEGNQIVNKLNYAVELDDGTKLNTSEDMKNVKKYKDLEISNIQFTSKDGNSVLLADVKNVGTTKHESEIVKITILGDNDEVITDIVPVIGTVEPGETIKLNAIVTADVVDAKDIKIEEKK